MGNNKSKYYYDYTRNCVCNGNCLCIDENNEDDRVPDYYKGKNGYEARKVCDNFELPYHIATAVTYLIRSSNGMVNKHNEPFDDYNKAIAHIEFQIEKLKSDSK